MSSSRKRVSSLPARPKDKKHTPQLLGSNESIIDFEDEEKEEEFFNDVYGGPTAQLIQGDESLEMSIVIRPVAKEKKKKKQKGEPTAPGQWMIDYIKKHKAATTVENLSELTTDATAVEDVKYTDPYMMTVLHYAAWYCSPSLISHMLLTWSADCTIEEENGLLPFHYAIASDCIESCALFIEKDKAITKATARGEMTSLHIAAIAGSGKVTSELILNSGEVDARNSQGHTPLALACRWGKVGVTSLLLEHGADCTIGANDGTTPLFFSTVYCRSVLPKMLDTLYDVDLDRMSEHLYLGDLSMKFNYKDNKFWHFSQLKWLALDKNMDIIMHPVVMRLVEIKYKKFATRRIMWTYGLNLLYAIAITATFILFGDSGDATIDTITLCEGNDWQDYLGLLFSLAAGLFASLIFITYLYTILNVKAAIRKESTRINSVMRNTALHYKFCHHKKVPKLTIVPKSKKISRQALAMNGYIMIMVQSMIGSVMAIAIIVLGVIMVVNNSNNNCPNDDTDDSTSETVAVTNNTNNGTDGEETIEQLTIDFFTSNFMRFCALAMLHAWFNLMANLRLVEIKYKKFATRRIMWTYGLNLLYAIAITATFILFGDSGDATIDTITLCEGNDWQDYLGLLFSLAAGLFASLIFITYLYTILNVKAAIRKESTRINSVMRNTALHYKFCHHKKVPKLTIVPKSKKISRQALAMNGYIMIMVQSMIGSVMAIAIIVLGVIMVVNNSNNNCPNDDTDDSTSETVAVTNNTNNGTDGEETIEQLTIDFFTSNFMRFCALAMLHAWFNLMANLRYTFLPISKLIITLTYALVDIFQFAVIFMLIFVPFCIIAKVQYFPNSPLQDVTMSLWRLSLVDGDLYDNGLQSQKDSGDGSTANITSDMMYGKTWWQFLVGIYMFSVAVVLINILIAMLSTTFQRVQEDSKAMSMLDKISYVGMLEMTRSDNAKKSDDKEIVKKHNPDIGKLDEMSERFRDTMADLDSKRTSEVLIQNSILKDRVKKLEKRNAKLKRASTKPDDGPSDDI